MDPTTTTRPDTHEMVVVHRVFRREATLLPDLIGAVPPGDTARARRLARHLRDYQAGLRAHHTGEDDLIWPLLLARVDLEADLVLWMEQQHEVIAATLDRVGAVLDRWERVAAVTERDELVGALRAHRVALLEHLADEEAHLLSLIEEHLSVAEWSALGERFANETPKPKLLFFLGAILEEADPAEQALILANLPGPVRLIWRLFGRRDYARRVARIRSVS
jgi:hemerythrin-like domain-containing protein